jgi:hypothetical protein
VRRRVSCWNTFIVAAILRESLPDPAVERSHPQWILRERFVTLNWTGLASGRYLGIVNYNDGTNGIGSTLVSIDNH